MKRQDNTNQDDEASLDVSLDSNMSDLDIAEEFQFTKSQSKAIEAAVPEHFWEDIGDGNEGMYFNCSICIYFVLWCPTNV